LGEKKKDKKKTKKRYPFGYPQKVKKTEIQKTQSQKSRFSKKGTPANEISKWRLFTKRQYRAPEWSIIFVCRKRQAKGSPYHALIRVIATVIQRLCREKGNKLPMGSALPGIPFAKTTESKNRNTTDRDKLGMHGMIVHFRLWSLRLPAPAYEVYIYLIYPPQTRY
jgi:hypothetical protein